MSGECAGKQDPDDADSELVEFDPSGRYARYAEVLGKGAFKTVYRAFDELEGIEVAWNQVKFSDVLQKSVDVDRLYSEVHLLKTLKHKNIIKFYHYWADAENGNLNIITEIFTSGTLRQYRKKHKRVDLRALKNWSRQILQGLLYLHSHDPPVIHRDLKCDNIFVNGNQGEVKIGDLGMAAMLHHARLARSVIGTPEFMAPELYEEEYNELVDIYAFGMCLLELVTMEYPYVECANAAQIYKKVTAGVKPLSLGKVTDLGVRRFIEKCIAHVSERVPAKELLLDPFLQIDEGDTTGVNHLMSDSSNSDDCNGQSESSNISRAAKSSSPGENRSFLVEGHKKDKSTITLTFHIADSTGLLHHIRFPFDVEADTAISVASEMVAELDLTNQDVTSIAAMIDSEIKAHIPQWVSGEAFDDNFGGETTPDKCDSEGNDDGSSLVLESDQSSLGGFILQKLPSGHVYWSDSPKAMSEGSPENPPHAKLPNKKYNLKGAHSFPNSPERHKHKGYYPNGEASPCSSRLNLACDDRKEFNSFHLSKSDAGRMKQIMEKVEHVLAEQEKEVTELRTKHILLVEELLEEIPSDHRLSILNMYKSKFSGS